MAKLNPTTMKDWQIAEIAEAEMIPFDEMCDKLAIPKEERIPYGQKIGRVDYLKCLERLKSKPDGNYIEVTAITPTPLGEGKSTTSVGLMEGLGMRGKNVGGALRQPSGGPTMNVKGTAAGGGNSRFWVDATTSSVNYTTQAISGGTRRSVASASGGG